MDGIIFQIQRFCLRDGDGIRTTVFLKGCPLSCLWCHNPEGQRRETQLSFQLYRCIACGQCRDICRNGVHTFGTGQGIHCVDFSKCQLCGRCIEACPTGCLELIGERVEAERLIKVVLLDRAFWRKLGGVTFSGGEPLLQAPFVLECARLLKKENVNVTVETSGYAPKSVMEALLPFVDCWLYDFKAGPEEKHKALCGVSNKCIHENFCFLCKEGARVILRYPMIPGINDSVEDMEALLMLEKECQDRIPVEVLPYHVMGKGKTQRIGIEYSAFLPEEDAKSETIEERCNFLRKNGIAARIV